MAEYIVGRYAGQNYLTHVLAVCRLINLRDAQHIMDAPRQRPREVPSAESMEEKKSACLAHLPKTAIVALNRTTELTCRCPESRQGPITDPTLELSCCLAQRFGVRGRDCEPSTKNAGRIGWKPPLNGIATIFIQYLYVLEIAGPSLLSGAEVGAGLKPAPGCGARRLTYPGLRRAPLSALPETVGCLLCDGIETLFF